MTKSAPLVLYGRRELTTPTHTLPLKLKLKPTLIVDSSGAE